MSPFGPTFEDVRRALGGSQGGFHALDERFRSRLQVWVTAFRANPGRFGVRWRRHIQVDDIVQEALTRAYKGLQGLTDPKPGSFWTWLKTITHHTIIDLMRRSASEAEAVEVGGRNDEEEPGAEAWAVGKEPAPSAGLLHADLRTRLGVALAALDTRDALLIEFVFLSGMEQKEVAALLDLSPARVNQLKARSLLKLRELLNDDQSLLRLLGGA